MMEPRVLHPVSFADVRSSDPSQRFWSRSWFSSKVSGLERSSSDSAFVSPDVLFPPWTPSCWPSFQPSFPEQREEEFQKSGPNSFSASSGSSSPPLLTFLSSLMACFLAFLSSVLSSLLRGCVETRGRSESLIRVMRSACLAVTPLLGRTSRGIPVLLDTRIDFGWGRRRTSSDKKWCLDSSFSEQIPKSHRHWWQRNSLDPSWFTYETIINTPWVYTFCKNVFS